MQHAKQHTPLPDHQESACQDHPAAKYAAQQSPWQEPGPAHKTPAAAVAGATCSVQLLGPSSAPEPALPSHKAGTCGIYHKPPQKAAPSKERADSSRLQRAPSAPELGSNRPAHPSTLPSPPGHPLLGGLFQLMLSQALEPSKQQQQWQWQWLWQLEPSAPVDATSGLPAPPDPREQAQDQQMLHACLQAALAELQRQHQADLEFYKPCLPDPEDPLWPRILARHSQERQGLTSRAAADSQYLSDLQAAERRGGLGRAQVRGWVETRCCMWQQHVSPAQRPPTASWLAGAAASDAAAALAAAAADAPAGSGAGASRQLVPPPPSSSNSSCAWWWWCCTMQRWWQQQLLQLWTAYYQWTVKAPRHWGRWGRYRYGALLSGRLGVQLQWYQRLKHPWRWWLTLPRQQRQQLRRGQAAAAAAGVDDDGYGGYVDARQELVWDWRVVGFTSQHSSSSAFQRVAEQHVQASLDGRAAAAAAAVAGGAVAGGGGGGAARSSRARA